MATKLFQGGGLYINPRHIVYLEEGVEYPLTGLRKYVKAHFVNGKVMAWYLDENPDLIERLVAAMEQE